MVKIAFVVAAAALTTAPPFTPAKAQGVKMAQVDMQGRHFDDRDPSSYYGERRRRSDSNNATVGVGPGGGPDSTAAWRLPGLNGATAAGSRAGSASATKRRATKKQIVEGRACHRSPPRNPVRRARKPHEPAG
jgi:hypothetical protein